MSLELIVLPLLIASSIYLLFRSFKDAFLVLLILSVLLHKEVFSIYMWDVLPVRIFMLGIMFYAFVRFCNWFIYRRNFAEVKSKLSDPFNSLLLLLWFVTGLSLPFSKNLNSSIFLYGFLTTITVLGLLLYSEFYNKPTLVLDYIKKYIFIATLLSLFGFFQLYLYNSYEILVGAIWNIPGNIARIGSTFWDVNHFGGFLSALLPVLGVLFLTADNNKQRLQYFLMLLPMTAVLFLTNSRTAWLLGFFALLMFSAIILYRKIGLKGLAYLGTTLVLITIPLLVEYSDKSSPFRARVKDYFHYRVDSFDSHFLLLTGTFQVFEKYPVLGGGYGSFYEHFSDTKIAPTYFGRDPAGLTVRTPAHTIWGEAISETGAVGLFVLLMLSALLFAVPLYASLTLKSTKEFMVTAAMASAIFGWFVAGIFYSYKSEFYWIILFLYFIYSASLLKERYSIENILHYFSKSRSASPALLILLSSALIFIGLGSNHLLPWDEAIYAQISKNIFLSNNYLDMVWRRTGEIWLEKPPLYIWATTFWMRLIGISEWASRLTSAIFGLSTIMVTYSFGKRLKGKYVGVLSAVSLITTVDFLKYSRFGMLDVSVTFFITLALYLYWIAKEGKSRFWFYSGLAVGFAVMVKGVVGLLPLPIIGLYELLSLILQDTKLNRSQIKSYLLFVFATLLVALPWHLVMYLRYGNQFLAIYIGYHVLARATQAIEDKGAPFYWYFIVLKVSMRLWFIALLGAYPFVLFKAFIKKNRQSIFLIIWSLFIFIFFSSATSKLVWYIIPIYPALSIIVAYFITSFVNAIGLRLVPAKLNVFRGFTLYVITFVAVVYLFLVKNLVYLSDLTGPQADLLQKKDQVHGVDTIVYADRIELPLILYYSDGPYEIVDFGPLKETLMFAPYDKDIVFITKESRYEQFKDSYPEIDLTAQENEWVLAVRPSKRSEEQDALKKITDELNSLNKDISKLVSRGENVPSELYVERENLFEQQELLKSRIDSFTTN